MGAIIIKSAKKCNKLLSELAKKLGGDIMHVNDDQFEDLALGMAIENIKTGELVDREAVMNQLKGE